MPSNFEPDVRNITAVTISDRAVVTTSANHGFNVDDYVRIFIPVTWGMNVYAVVRVSAVTATTFTTDLNTLNQDPLVEPAAPFVQAQAISITGPVENVA